MHLEQALPDLTVILAHGDTDQFVSEVTVGGTWRSEELRRIHHPLGEVAIVGHCFATDEAIHHTVGKAIDGNKPELLADLPGAHSDILLQLGKAAVISNNAGLFPLYYRHDPSQTVISSRPSLAASGEYRPDLLRLASFLACPGGEELSAERSLIAGVSWLRSGKVLHISETDLYTSTHEQFQPDRGVHLDEAAERLHVALEDSIRARVGLADALDCSVSGDHSGGYDSTTLMWELARQTPHSSVAAFTVLYSGAPTGDLPYIQRSLDLNPRLTPYFVKDPEVAYGSFDEISLAEDINLGTIEPQRMRDYYKRIADTGSRIHLVGSGGDEVLEAHPAYLADLLRTAQLGRFLGDGMLRARASYGFPLAVWERAAKLALTTPAKAMSRLALELTDDNLQPQQTSVFRLYGLGPAAEFLTNRTRSELAELASAQAARLELPPGFGFADYLSLAGVRAAGRGVMSERYLALDSDVSPHAPYLDKDVLAACFSLHSSQRTDPRHLKAILRKAYDGIIPSEILSRPTKGSSRRLAYHDMRQELPSWMKLFQDSLLADAGIIDAARVRERLNSVDNLAVHQLAGLYNVIAAEIMLRQLDRSQRKPQQFIDSPEVNIAPIRTQSEGASPAPDSCYAIPSHIRIVQSPHGALALLNPLKKGDYNAYKQLNRTAGRMLLALNEKGSFSATLDELALWFPKISRERLGLATDLRDSISIWESSGFLLKSEEIRPLYIQPPAENTDPSIGDTAMVQRLEKVRLTPTERIALVGAFAYSMACMTHTASIQKRRLTLAKLQDRFAYRDATEEEAYKMLTAGHLFARRYYIGRAACMQIPYVAAIASGLLGRRVTWRFGAGFDPPSLHASIAVGGKVIMTPADGGAAGVQSFFTEDE